MKTLNIFYLVIYWTQKVHNDFIFLCSLHVRLFHSLLRVDFPSRWLQLLQWPLVSLLGVPDRVEESLLQNWCRSWTSYYTRTLAVVTDMHHHTELSFVDEFRWVSPLHYFKNGWQNAVLLWCMLQPGPPSLQLLLRRRVAFLHRTATCRPLFKPPGSLLST